MDKKQYLEEMAEISKKHSEILGSISDNDSFEIVVEKLEQAGVYEKKARQVDELYDDYLESRIKSGDLSAFLTLATRYIKGCITLIKIELIYLKARRKVGI